MTLKRWTVPVALALALCAGFAPAPSHAQEPAPVEEGAGSGRSLDGYFLMGILAGLAMFIVAKSARRS